MTASTMPGVNVRNVTDVDRRTARRLGMSAEEVNSVISTWAEEYLNVERDRKAVSVMANPAPATPAKRPVKAAAKAPAKSAPKVARAPRKAAAPKFDHKPDDGHDYIPVSNRADADCMECGAKEGAHPEEHRVTTASTAEAEKLAGDRN